MAGNQQLRRAITAARSGRELLARDLFLEIVAADPQNELAWIWLAGLLDTLDDRIEACQKVLAINPFNLSIRRYLSPLLAEKEKILAEKKLIADRRLEEARACLKAKKTDEALYLLRGLTRAEIVNPEAWRALAEFSPQLEEQIHALKNLLRLLPGDVQARKTLEHRQHYQQNPLEFAALYEEQGNFEQAISEYNRAAQLSSSTHQWDEIYWKINRIEKLRREKIVHVSPAISIARLTLGPVLVYLAFMLIQVGIWPFAHPEPLLWMGFVWVLLGSLMIALTTVHSPERLKQILSQQFGANGLPVARSALVLGWFLVLLPYGLLLTVALLRLSKLISFRFPG
jgi:tetratricopeptide (TPR) repeat protein